MTIQVKSCGDCPFFIKDAKYGNGCDLNIDIDYSIYAPTPYEFIHFACPLKKGQVVVELENTKTLNT